MISRTCTQVFSSGIVVVLVLGGSGEELGRVFEIDGGVVGTDGVLALALLTDLVHPHADHEDNAADHDPSGAGYQPQRPVDLAHDLLLFERAIPRTNIVTNTMRPPVIAPTVNSETYMMCLSVSECPGRESNPSCDRRGDRARSA